MKQSSIRHSALVARRSLLAFTLVELLTVVAIIALLIGLVVGISSFASRKSAVSRAQADMEKIKIALEDFRAVYGRYPTNTVATQSPNLTGQLWVKPQKEGRRPFLAFPGWNDTNMAYQVVDPWGRDYRYIHRPSAPYADNNNFKFGYDLWSLGPDAMEAADNINNWSGN